MKISQTITADQMREVDQAMVEEYGIQLTQMMENAGRNLAHLARERLLEDDPRGIESWCSPGRAETAGVAWYAPAISTTGARRSR